MVVQVVTRAAPGTAVLVAVETVALLQPLVLLEEEEEEAGIAGNREEEVVGEWHQSVEVATVKHLM